MSRSTNKLPLILLSLILIISPLQGAFAALNFYASPDISRHGMNHNGPGAVAMDAAKAMSGDCQHCTEQNGCDGHDCSHTHCASCIPGLLGFTQLDVTIRGADLYPRFEQVLSNRFTSHPFRPPKA